MTTGFSFLLYGQSKSGKSYLADTAPAPRLILDAEGGASTRFTPSTKVVWDPSLDGPPEADGTWDTCVVYVRSFSDVQKTYDWLNAGRHPFKSVIIDSLSETQQRCVDALVGTDQMKMQDWGELLRKMSTLVRSYRDLIIHPTNPVSVVCLVAMTKETQEGVKKPYLQGALAQTIPYYVDVIGYLHGEVTEDGVFQQRLLVGPHPQFEAGDRTGRLGTVVEEPNIQRMLDQIYNK
jgi:AAA domain